MIIVGIGANLAGEDYPDARATCEAALLELPSRGIRIDAVSAWYESEPVPRSDQPWYSNAVVRVRSELTPADLLSELHQIEARFGRERGAVNAARTLDLDLIDHEGAVSEDGLWPILPHPRMHARAFVLLPLRDLEPGWRHPKLGASIDALVSALPKDQKIRRHET